MDVETNQSQPNAPTFVDPTGRSRAFPLKWPVTVDGRVYAEIRLARLTVAEVAAFFESIKDAPKAGLAWPIYRDEAGASLPQAVLDALDDDDGYVIEKAVDDFLPQRLAAILERVGGRPDGAPTDSSSAA